MTRNQQQTNTTDHGGKPLSNLVTLAGHGPAVAVINRETGMTTKIPILTEAQLREMADETARQLSTIAERLFADVPPGHVMYISKTDAARWLLRLANNNRDYAGTVPA